jgi:hypothetical protein
MQLLLGRQIRSQRYMYVHIILHPKAIKLPFLIGYQMFVYMLLGI